MSKRKTLTMGAWATNPANKAAVLETVKRIGGDGWTIFSSLAFPQVPAEVLAVYNHEQRSGTGKQAIHREDGTVGNVFGIHGLALLEGIADAHGIYSSKMGRGFRAQELSAKLIAVLEVK